MGEDEAEQSQADAQKRALHKCRRFVKPKGEGRDRGERRRKTERAADDQWVGHHVHGNGKERELPAHLAKSQAQKKALSIFLRERRDAKSESKQQPTHQNRNSTRAGPTSMRQSLVHLCRGRPHVNDGKDRKTWDENGQAMLLPVRPDKSAGRRTKGQRTTTAAPTTNVGACGCHLVSLAIS